MADVAHDRVWTIPNAITLLRLALLVPVCWFILTGTQGSWLPVILLGVWASTDWVDGLLARLLDQRSKLGELLDPLADRLGIIGVALTLAFVGLVPWWVVVVIFVTDLAVASLASRAAKAGNLGVSWLGKIRTALLFVAVVALVMGETVWTPAGPVGTWLLYLGVVLHLAAGAGYIRKALRASRPGLGAAGDDLRVPRPGR